MRSKSVQKCSTAQSFTFPKFTSFKLGTLVGQVNRLAFICLFITAGYLNSTYKNCLFFLQFTKTSEYEKREERYSTTNVLSTNNLHKLRFNVMRSTKMKALERSSRLAHWFLSLMSNPHKI